jgi:hypothetical protein
MLRNGRLGKIKRQDDLTTKAALALRKQAEDLDPYRMGKTSSEAGEPLISLLAGREATR